ncbi:hypothetical protein [Acidovorax sp. Root217]|uniref:hypothetical protein n=1 Tax=Acidovorax sp. Root217 TaxID=1736492 RepID=UPI000708DCF3|nr:hypothetical protein [Acidovorax sp. Root217]KRC20929.1 hypothetical protein ASE31_25000 [Acidovorax sp. Root217]
MDPRTASISSNAAAARDALAPEPATLAHWERTLQRANAALRMDQPVMALAYQQQALVIALRIAQVPPAGREDDCIAALVVSHLNLADLQVEAGALEECTQLLCSVHATLLGLMADGSRGTALQQAAWRHSRETHAALVRHVQAHGAHPDITAVLAAASGVLQGAAH